jgi:hypothetical protein
MLSHPQIPGNDAVRFPSTNLLIDSEKEIQNGWYFHSEGLIRYRRNDFGVSGISNT